jgi:TolA-binding protein
MGVYMESDLRKRLRELEVKIEDVLVQLQKQNQKQKQEQDQEQEQEQVQKHSVSLENIGNPYVNVYNDNSIFILFVIVLVVVSENKNGPLNYETLKQMLTLFQELKN